MNKKLLLHQRGEIMGIAESLVAFVQSFVPVLAGIVYATIGLTTFSVFALMNIGALAVIYYQTRTFFLASNREVH